VNKRCAVNFDAKIVGQALKNEVSAEKIKNIHPTWRSRQGAQGEAKEKLCDNFPAPLHHTLMDAGRSASLSRRGGMRFCFPRFGCGAFSLCSSLLFRNSF
jgi:hypothetical protein